MTTSKAGVGKSTTPKKAGRPVGSRALRPPEVQRLLESNQKPIEVMFANQEMYLEKARGIQMKMFGLPLDADDKKTKAKAEEDLKTLKAEFELAMEKAGYWAEKTAPYVHAKMTINKNDVGVDALTVALKSVLATVNTPSMSATLAADT